MADFAARMRDWTEKAKRNVDLVVKDSAQDLCEQMTRRQPGAKETGGSYKEGFVPVDTGELINSIRSSVNSGEPIEGPESYVLAIAEAGAGDSISVVFTAPHAPAMEYGTKHTGGRFFVRNAVTNWDQIVEANAARYK